MSFKIKTRREILYDIVNDARKHPKGWKAIFGMDRESLSKDYYIFNSETGIYLLKEYQKNPFEVIGIGGKIARNVDEEIENEISKFGGDFGIVQGDIQKIFKNIQKGVSVQTIFNAATKGKDMGINIPMKGRASTSEDSFNNMYNIFASKQKKLDSKFKRIATIDGVYTSYG
jgi:hypothetical protein